MRHAERGAGTSGPRGKSTNLTVVCESGPGHTDMYLHAPHLVDLLQQYHPRTRDLDVRKTLKKVSRQSGGREALTSYNRICLVGSDAYLRLPVALTRCGR